MIGFLSGRLADISENTVIIDVGGVGFEVLVPAGTVFSLSAGGIGTDVKLFTYTHVREDALLLYGFLSKEELLLYKKLITVNGIGPKVGLGLLSGMRVDELRFAIASGDVKSISRVPGIGKKTAERLILDLRDSIASAGAGVEEYNISGISPADMGKDTEASDAVEALAALGYSKMDASSAVQRARKDMPSGDTEKLLKGALKYLA